METAKKMFEELWDDYEKIKKVFLSLKCPDKLTDA